jgi:hypothetical protein
MLSNRLRPVIDAPGRIGRDSFELHLEGERRRKVLDVHAPVGEVINGGCLCVINSASRPCLAWCSVSP